VIRLWVTGRTACFRAGKGVTAVGANGGEVAVIHRVTSHRI
jgi:hypothetical protein